MIRVLDQREGCPSQLTGLRAEFGEGRREDSANRIDAIDPPESNRTRSLQEDAQPGACSSPATPLELAGGSVFFGCLGLVSVEFWVPVVGATLLILSLIAGVGACVEFVRGLSAAPQDSNSSATVQRSQVAWPTREQLNLRSEGTQRIIVR